MSLKYGRKEGTRVMNREVFLKQISIKLRNEDDSDICCIYLDKDSIPSQLLGNLSNKIRGIGKHAMCCGPCAESMCLLGGGVYCQEDQIGGI